MIALHPAPAALVGSLLLSACAANVPADSGFDDVQDLVAHSTDARLHWNRGSPEDDEVRESVQKLLSSELTAEAAVQVALLSNADLQAKYEDLGIAHADLVQAGLLRNPILDVEARFPEHPVAPVEVHVIEDFLDVFLLPLRKRVAAARFEEKKLEVADLIVRQAADVRSAFFEVQAAQQAVEMRLHVAKAAGAAADAAQRLHEAGNLNDLELASATALSGQAKLDLAQSEAELLDRRERLTSAMGLWGEDAGWSVAQRLPDLPEKEIAREGLESLAVSNNFALLAARQEIEVTARSLGLAHASALVPEVNVGLHYEREPSGPSTLGPSVELPLPIFDQGQAANARAQSLLRQSQQRYVALAVHLRSEVRALRDRLFAARSRAKFYADTILPLRARIVAETQLQYNAMQVGVFQLLQARQAEIDAGREWIGALRDYWVTRSELARAVGGNLDPKQKVETQP